MDEKVHIKWGKRSVNEPPSYTEISNVLDELEKKAAASNAVHLTVSHGMVQWLGEHLDNAYVWTVKGDVGPNCTCWIIISPDYETARAEAKIIPKLEV